MASLYLYKVFHAIWNGRPNSILIFCKMGPTTPIGRYDTVYVVQALQIPTQERLMPWPPCGVRETDYMDQLSRCVPSVNDYRMLQRSVLECATQIVQSLKYCSWQLAMTSQDVEALR
jgi:hypothetical protein